jgi:hypothetical protein
LLVREGGRVEEGAGVEDASALDPGVEGAGVEDGWSWEDDSAEGVGVGVGVGESGGADEGASDDGAAVLPGAEVSEGAAELPVPACRLCAWCKYASMPSIWRASSMLRADEMAMSAQTAKRSHDCRIVLSMFVVIGKRKWAGGWRRSVRLYGCVSSLLKGSCPINRRATVAIVTRASEES